MNRIIIIDSIFIYLICTDRQRLTVLNKYTTEVIGIRITSTKWATPLIATTHLHQRHQSTSTQQMTS